MSDSGFLSHYSKIQVSRAAVGLVLFLNVQCAIQFLSSPNEYATGFELSGFSGAMAIRGMGILLLMWNVPHVFAMIHPQKYRISYIQAIIMQVIGLLGETILWYSIPEGHDLLTTGISRFILFDGVGFVLLIFGYILVL